MSARVRSVAVVSLFTALSIALCLVFIFYWDEIEALRKWDYPFVFLISFVAGSSLPIPAPYVIVVFAMAPILNPFLVGLVAGMGAGLGGNLVYWLGRGGRRLFPWAVPLPQENSSATRWSRRITGWARNRGSLVVFLMSALVNPAFGPMALTLGALKYPAMKFVLLCWAGNTVKSLFIAFSGYLGLGFLLRIFGVNI